MDTSDISTIVTPARCYADFCLVPVRPSFNPILPLPVADINVQKNEGRHGQRLGRARGRCRAALTQGERADVHDALGRDDGRSVFLPPSPCTSLLFIIIFLF